MNPQVKLTGVIIQSKSGGYTGYFAEVPEAIAEGNTQEEVKSNMFEALSVILDFRKSEANDNSLDPSVSSFDVTLEVA